MVKNLGVRDTHFFDFFDCLYFYFDFVLIIMLYHYCDFFPLPSLPKYSFNS